MKLRKEWVTLKHLCREYDCSPGRLRQILRSFFGTHPKGRWKWDPIDPQLYKVRLMLTTYFNATLRGKEDEHWIKRSTIRTPFDKVSERPPPEREAYLNELICQGKLPTGTTVDQIVEAELAAFAGINDRQAHRKRTMSNRRIARKLKARGINVDH